MSLFLTNFGNWEPRKTGGSQTMAADFVDALNSTVGELVRKACQRAQQNGRRMVMGRDV